MILQIQRAESVERKTDEEPRVDEKYLNKFKGVKEIKECIVRYLQILLAYFVKNYILFSLKKRFLSTAPILLQTKFLHILQGTK